MKKLLTTLALTCTAALAQAQVPATLQAKLQHTLDSMATRYNFKGLSAAVSYKSSGIWKSATGISYGTTPLSPDMLIGIGSNTKTFVSALMLQFVENGQVSLEDTIGHWIQGYNNIPGNVTIRQLLNHTSGIASYTNNSAYNTALVNDLTHMWTTTEVLQGFVLAPDFAPGTGWNYSNTNYIIAGVIEEQLSGKPIYQLIRDSILVPQGLNHTFMPPFETTTDEYAHFWSDQNGSPALDDAMDWNHPAQSPIPPQINSSVQGAGALVSTAEDNVKFWMALMKGQIIKKTTLQNDMLQWSGFGTTNSEYGLGIFLEKYFNKPVLSHGGTWIGQINDNLSDTTNDIYITVLSNQDSLDNEIVMRVVGALYKTALAYTPALSLNAIDKNEWIKCYPNPANDVLRLEFTSDMAQTLTVTDISGKERLTQQLKTGDRSTSLDVSLLAPGTYILTIHTANGASQTKFTVQH